MLLISCAHESFLSSFWLLSTFNFKSGKTRNRNIHTQNQIYIEMMRAYVILKVTFCSKQSVVDFNDDFLSLIQMLSTHANVSISLYHTIAASHKCDYKISISLEEEADGQEHEKNIRPSARNNIILLLHVTEAPLLEWHRMAER